MVCYSLCKRILLRLRLERVWLKLAHGYVYKRHPLPPDAGNNCLFQVVGMPRSGTTLITTILNAHDNILCLSEPFRQWFYRGEVEYALPGQDRVSLWKGHPSKLLIHLCQEKERGLIGFKETYVGGTDFQSTDFFIQRNHNLGLVARTIAQVRDPRDIWASMLKSPKRTSTDPELIKGFAQCWNEFCAWIREQGVFFIRYEDLVTVPERELARLAEYLGIDYTDQLLHPAPILGAGDRKGREGGKIFSSSIGGHARRISAQDRDYLQQHCAEMMDTFTYQ